MIQYGNRLINWPRYVALYGRRYVRVRRVSSFAEARFWGLFYLFGNRKDVLPGRWGFGICGLIEIGSRNPQDPVGVWLKEHGLWPW